MNRKCIYVYMYVCMHVCMYVYVCMYMKTQILLSNYNNFWAYHLWKMRRSIVLNRCMYVCKYVHYVCMYVCNVCITCSSSSRSSFPADEMNAFTLLTLLTSFLRSAASREKKLTCKRIKRMYECMYVCIYHVCVIGISFCIFVYVFM